MTVAYGNLLVAGPDGFPPARERRENEKGGCQWIPMATFSWQDHMDSRLRGKDESLRGKDERMKRGGCQWIPMATFSWQDHTDSRLRGKDERMKRVGVSGFLWQPSRGRTIWIPACAGKTRACAGKTREWEGAGVSGFLKSRYLGNAADIRQQPSFIMRPPRKRSEFTDGSP